MFCDKFVCFVLDVVFAEAPNAISSIDIDLITGSLISFVSSLMIIDSTPASVIETISIGLGRFASDFIGSIGAIGL